MGEGLGFETLRMTILQFEDLFLKTKWLVGLLQSQAHIPRLQSTKIKHFFSLYADLICNDLDCLDI